MLKSLYETIQKDAAPVILKVGDREYSDKALHPVNAPQPKTLTVTTLTGLVDYLNTNVDKLKIEEMLCHVECPALVSIISGLEGSFKDRGKYILAKLDQIEIPFNKWMDAETFNIALQSCFVEDADRALVLKYVSQVVATAEATTSDDGISQAVTMRTGIASKGVKELPNPVVLRPYRTFSEVDQPASKFVFRARQECGKMQYMLTEADGSAWRSTAMKSIKNYMEISVTGLKVIA